MNDDYIILVNEDGQPYIAHAGMVSNAASGVGRGVRQSHKYIMKIGEGLKARYFYTQDEIRAYQQEMARKAKGTTEQVKDKVQSTTDRMKEEFRKKKEDAKDKLGFDERERMRETQDKWLESKIGTKEREQAMNEYTKARDDYNKTTLGKLEKADMQAGQKIDDAVWNTINKMNIKGKDIHDQYSAAREEERKNPTEENKRKADALWDEWLKTPHAKLAFSTSGVGNNGVVGEVGRVASNAASKVKEISETQANKIRQKLNSGANVAQEDLRALWNYYSNK